jgi:hypothetical protein
MLRYKLVPMVTLLVAATLLVAQDEGKLTSGPKAGALVPTPFESFNMNGPAKDRPHCLICQFGLSPTVLVFAKEPADGKDAPLTELAKKLDELTTEFEDRNFSAGIVIISPDGRDSTNNASEKEARNLIDEKVKRDKLYDRLKKRAEPLKNAILSFMPEPPKKFNINAKADVTVVYYERMKVVDNWAFGPDQMRAEDVDAIVKKVRDTVPRKKKTAK